MRCWAASAMACAASRMGPDRSILPEG
jgi:hypothetical protein